MFDTASARKIGVEVIAKASARTWRWKDAARVACERRIESRAVSEADDIVETV